MKFTKLLGAGLLLPSLLLLSACGTLDDISIPYLTSSSASDTRSIPVVAEPVPAEPEITPIITTLEWSPSFSRPIRQLEEVLTEATDQADLNRTISNISHLYDAQLYVLFHDLLDYLPEQARFREVEEQNQWLDMRMTQATSSFHRYDGGDLGVYHAGATFIAVTKDRIEVISRRLDQVAVR
ncbi:hypothetical protein [Nitrincola alkalilacustris]|uniref:hypothetical protein n=1 Tax=Nitrincola alkalilacustris TaxID=1571224 RepID=UPI00124D8121|nr:hypothetical protein [Nitrincola alkalilacustris]